MDVTEAVLSNGTIHGRHPWEIVRADAVVRMTKKSIPDAAGAKIAVLDMGCGDGYVAGRLSALMPQAAIVGVDPELDRLPAGDNSSSSSRATPVKIVATLDEARRFLGKPADIILLLDVLEHIERDADFLHTLADDHISGTQARFLIAVPAFAGLYSAHDRFLHHLRRYSQAALDETIDGAGLLCVEMGYWFFSLLLVRCFQKIAGSIIPPRNITGIRAWKPRPLLDLILKYCLTFDIRLCRIMRKTRIVLPGLSLYALCKKPA